MEQSAPLDAFTQGWETCSLVPYLDGAGKWTIAWGHLMQPNDPMVACTQDEADSLFITDMAYVADRVTLLLPVALSQQQFDACCDFAFRLGPGRLAGSTLRKRILGGYLDEVPDQLLRWNKEFDPVTQQEVVVPGLAKRCAAERAIWMYADYSRRP